MVAELMGELERWHTAERADRPPRQHRVTTVSAVFADQLFAALTCGCPSP